MIFITLGSQKFQFNRMLIAVDKLVEKGIIQDEIFAQRGNSDYVPCNFKSTDFLSREEFGELMAKSDVVITHAGTGAIMGAVKCGKKVIAVPRKKEFGEHVDNHQYQIVNEFSAMNIIEPCYELSDLEKAYKNIFNKEYATYESNTHVFINTIESFLENM